MSFIGIITLIELIRRILSACNNIPGSCVGFDKEGEKAIYMKIKLSFQNTSIIFIDISYI